MVELTSRRLIKRDVTRALPTKPVESTSSPSPSVSSGAAMVGTRKRREPLVLASTRSLLDSVLGHTPVAAPSLVRLPAGLLRLADGRASELGVDGSISVGVSVSVLKRLSTSSGSLVAFFTLFKELDGGLM